MMMLDAVVLIAALVLASWRLLAPRWRPRARIAAFGAASLPVAIQWLEHGFTWQSIPAYVLLGSGTLPRVRAGKVARRVDRVGFIGLAGLSIAVWALPAVPTLPQPDGPYALGTHIYRWTDRSRDEPHTAEPADRRSVIVQAWYPAARVLTTGSGARLPYIDGLQQLPATVGGIPSFVLRRYGEIDTHAEAGAPLAPRHRPWPVVIFSPGYGAPRAVYTGLVTQLASRGFVVMVLDHPYEAAITELPDGRRAEPRELIRPGERNRIPYMIREQARRTADIRFVIDQLASRGVLKSPLSGGRIGVATVAAVGHSFGGAAAVAAMSEDVRIGAAANLDGTPYGDLPSRPLSRPMMLIQSDFAETNHSRFFLDGNAKLLARAPQGRRYEIKGADHFSFTDALFFVAPPARWLLTRTAGGPRGPAATQRATAELLAAFLSGALTGGQD